MTSIASPGAYFGDVAFARRVVREANEAMADIVGERPAVFGASALVPLPDVEARVVDPITEQPLPDGEVGEVQIRGPHVFKGYWQMPEKTAAELREDGFFITGDLGQIDADGYVSIVGRNKDLIIVSGFNVFPAEVEEVLRMHPAVAEAGVERIAVGAITHSSRAVDIALDLEAA